MSAPLRVLIACEFTGTVRREFDKLGHDVWSCDLRRSEDNTKDIYQRISAACGEALVLWIKGQSTVGFVESNIVRKLRLAADIIEDAQKGATS